VGAVDGSGGVSESSGGDAGVSGKHLAYLTFDVEWWLVAGVWDGFVDSDLVGLFGWDEYWYDDGCDRYG